MSSFVKEMEPIVRSCRDVVGLVPRANGTDGWQEFEARGQDRNRARAGNTAYRKRTTGLVGILTPSRNTSSCTSPSCVGRSSRAE